MATKVEKAIEVSKGMKRTRGVDTERKMRYAKFNMPVDLHNRISLLCDITGMQRAPAYRLLMEIGLEQMEGKI